MDKVIKLALILAVVFSGCKSAPTVLKSHPPPIDVQKPIVMVGSVKEAIQTQAASIKADAMGIKTQVQAGLSLQPDSQIFELIGIKADTIEASSSGILSEAVKLTAVQDQLGKVKTDFDLLKADFSASQQMVKERDASIKKIMADNDANVKKIMTANGEAVKKLEDTIAKMKDATTAKLKMWLLIATLSFIGLAASAVGFGIYLGKPKLFVFAPVFLGCASLTYFVSSYLKEILIFGGCAFVVLVGYSIWRWKQEQDDLKKNETALKEQVSTIEKVPDEIWAQIKQIWKDNVSPESKKLVELARVELKAQGLVK